ncbi:MAG: FHA domain-containing protein [Acidobacteriota bacterium]|nr:FHA domain-containing protein [Acidobacteriota bacterium]MDH3530440.1 FHA domain-containing protein [Acidobacteriota bacterium]
MGEYKLTYKSEEGPEEIGLATGKITFGRGSDADYRFADDGLSRIHATVYCEGGNIWIVDENSSNGTFVNGVAVSLSGTPLEAEDVIKIGHHTNLRVVRSIAAETPGPATEASSVPAASAQGPAMLVPLAVIGVALLLIISSVAVIGISIYGGDEKETGSADRERSFDNGEFDEGEVTETSNGPDTPGGTTSTSATTNSEQPVETIQSPADTYTPPPPSLPKKQYAQMSDAEKNLYIKVKAEKVAQLIGNKSSGDIPPAAVASIRKWVDQYARRFRSTRLDDCRGRGSFTKSDMETVLARAAKNVPFITRSFRSQAVDPQVGIYVAMIESEHCVCLQSGTGPLGMFQFTKATGESFGLKTRSGASPSNPDERCEPQPASLASAKYLKYLSGRIGTGPLSVPLAIASYNSGEGGLGKNLMTALTSNSSEDRSFWTLVANAEKLSEQFNHENIKYVPKFFGAAIVGENPRDFGSRMQPLSTYTR